MPTLSYGDWSMHVGETRRTMRSRIKEHLRIDKQTFHEHLRTHNIDLQSESKICWKILHSNYELPVLARSDRSTQPSELFGQNYEWLCWT